MTGLLMVALTSGCVPLILVNRIGNGRAATDTRELPAFDRIEFLLAGRLEVQVGQPQTVTISGDSNLLALVQTQVDAGKLTVRASQTFHPTLPLVVRVSVPDLTLLQVDGAGEIELAGLDNPALRVELTGAGQITLSGQTENLTIQLAGAGDVDATNLTASAVSVIISGAGRVDVAATQTLDVTITGVGLVSYADSPTITITQNTSGIGELSRRD